jgi:RNA-binding protein NOB1
MTKNNRDTVVSLVLDSAPLIKRVNLFPMAQKFYTIPEVIAEIRDKQAREQLENSLVDIQVKVPSEEALNAVIKFAKKTGDLATLSKTDLKVIALTWMLEKEAGNLDSIRTEPIRSQVKYGKQKGTKKATKNEEEEKKEKEPLESENKEGDDDIGAFNEQIDWENEFGEIEDKEFESDYDVDIDADDDEEMEEGEKEEKEEKEENEEQQPKEEEATSSENKEETKEEEASTSEVKEEEKKEEDDDEGWITPDNINKYHAKHYGWNSKKEAKTYDVACMTADFAMQYVLIQMNLKILSVDGMIIHRIKNWELRCHACYFTTTDMSKKFCPQCGHDTLIRTSVSIDKYGNKVYHLKKNFNYRLRGTKYSIPTYVGGQNANNIILSEDQNEYQKALKQQKFKARKEKVVDLLDPDYLNTLFTGEDSKLNGRNKGKTRKTRNDYTGDIIIGYGRRNPNERRRKRK